VNPKILSFLKKLVIAVAATVLGVFVIAYAGDYGVFRYIFNPPQAVTCVNSIFPHGGYAPCWYLQRNKEQRTDI
jgi:hypothetical protein